MNTVVICKTRNAYQVLVGKLERKRPLGRPMHRWEDNIKKNNKETGWWGMSWTNLTKDNGKQQGLLNTMMNLHVP
jgi:hypothetical protein